MTRCKQGEAEIDVLIAKGQLGEVKADRGLADLMLAEARRHLASSEATTDTDPTGSFALAYDAGRKALASILENQGLRATSSGGHIAIEDAARAQLVPPMQAEVNQFGWLRKLRNSSQYPSHENPMADNEDAATAREYAAALIDMEAKALDVMGSY